MTFTSLLQLNGNSFSNVSPGSTAVVDVPTDGTYYEFTLGYKRGSALATLAQLKSDIDEIRIQVNGKTQQVYSATQLIAWLQFHDQVVSDGFLQIPLALPWRTTAVGQDITRMGTADVQTFQIEIDINGAAVNPVLDLSYSKSLANTPMGDILKFRRQVLGVTSVGIRNETNLPKNDRYLQMHLFMGGAADINSVNIELDSRRVWAQTKAQNSAFLSRNGYIEQPNVFSLPFDYRDRIGEFLDPFVNNQNLQRLMPHGSFQLDMDMAAANDVTMMQVLIGARD